MALRFKIADDMPPWIESHVALNRHPKIFRLASLMDWNVREAIGAVHMLWHWAADYALDGDLSRFEPAIIAQAASLDGAEGERFFQALVTAGFIDTEPFVHIHDWLDYIQSYLKAKYRHQLEKLEAITSRYGQTCLTHVKDMSKTRQKQENTVCISSSSLSSDLRDKIALREDIWTSYCEYRGPKFSEQAAKLAYKKLVELHRLGNDPNLVIEQSILNDWKGLFPVREQNGGRGWQKKQAVDEFVPHYLTKKL